MTASDTPITAQDDRAAAAHQGELGHRTPTGRQAHQAERGHQEQHRQRRCRPRHAAQPAELSRPRA